MVPLAKANRCCEVAYIFVFWGGVGDRVDIIVDGKVKPFVVFMKRGQKRDGAARKMRWFRLRLNLLAKRVVTDMRTRGQPPY